MAIAIAEAKKAAAKGEVPCGAVIVLGDKVVSKAHNLREIKQSATAHAEIIAIDKACKKLGTWRLDDCDIYVTKEPCPMCAGAIFQARFRALIYGSPDQKSGAAGTLLNIVNDPRLNHQVDVTSGVMEKENTKLLQKFFKDLRKNKRSGSEASVSQAEEL